MENCRDLDLKEVVYKPTTIDNLEKNAIKFEVTAPKKDTLFLYFSAFTANLLIFTSGCTLVWTSPVLSRLKSNNTEDNPLGHSITPFETSLIAGLPYLGGMIGPVISGRLCDSIGRKQTLVVLATVKFIAFVILAFGRVVYLYCIARIVLGLCFFSTMAVLTIFLTEISENHNRGKFVCLMGLFLVLGNVYAFVLGPLFSIKVFTLLCAAPLLICILPLVFFVPESPIFLISKGNEYGAITSLRKLRDKRDVSKDLDDMKILLKETSKNADVNFVMICKDPILRKGLIIGLGILFNQAFSGIPIIFAYTGPIFDSIGISGNVVAIVVGIIKAVMYSMTSTIVEKAGRKTLLLISTSTAGVSLFFLGLYFYWESIEFRYTDQLIYMPIISVVSYVITYSIGLGPLPMTLVGEVFPNDYKATAVSLIMIMFSAFTFVVIFGFPFVAQFLGINWGFWISSTVCFSGIAFVYFIVPETKGKSFLDIQKLLKS